MAVVWNRVTTYSQIIAIILFVGVFFSGMWIGTQVQKTRDLSMPAMVMTGSFMQHAEGQASTTQMIGTYACKVPDVPAFQVFVNGTKATVIAASSSAEVGTCSQIAAPVGP